MQAVILAGGLGTRLGPLTHTIPKPMVMVAGVPYLEHQVRLLARQGTTDLVLLTGYLGEQIEAHFGDGKRFGVTVRYSREPQPIGTGGALRDAGALLRDLFLVIYGDSYLPIDYREPYAMLTESGATGVVVVYNNGLADTTVHNNIAVGGGGLITRYDKDSPGDSELQYVEAGVLAFRRSVLDWIPGSGTVSLEKEIFPRLIARGELRAHITRQRFYDIGTPERLEAIERYLAHHHHADAISH